jgi:hypothetical protein
MILNCCMSPTATYRWRSSPVMPLTMRACLFLYHGQQHARRRAITARALAGRWSRAARDSLRMRVRKASRRSPAAPCILPIRCRRRVLKRAMGCGPDVAVRFRSRRACIASAKRPTYEVLPRWSYPNLTFVYFVLPEFPPTRCPHTHNRQGPRPPPSWSALPPTRASITFPNPPPPSDKTPPYAAGSSRVACSQRPSPTRLSSTATRLLSRASF